MGAGDVRFETPEHIRKAAKEALDNGQTRMTESKGLPKLRKAIANKLQSENDIDVSKNRIIVTPGSKQALFESIFSLINEGDEVITLDPSWVSYEAIIKMAGGKINRVPLDPTQGFKLGEGTLSDEVSNKTKLLIINTPVNPTGKVFTKDELKKIRDLAVDYDFWIITDEIYEKLIFDEVEHISPGSLEGMDSRTITVNGFSKTYAMTGWRLGYFTAPEELLEEANKVHTQTVSCATNFVQHAGIAALEGPMEPVEAMHEQYKNRRDILVNQFNRAGFNFSPPQSTFYAFIPVDTQDDVSLCEDMLRENNVATTPGTAFGMSGYIRLSFPMEKKIIKEGVRRVIDYLE
jgi:aspartate aminotransferase